jgi:hypothetical protein
MIKTKAKPYDYWLSRKAGKVGKTGEIPTFDFRTLDLQGFPELKASGEHFREGKEGKKREKWR